MKRAATREDVARIAGVSVASVSRAINNSGYVSKEAKERILEIAGNLSYNPNPIALSLQSQKTRQLILYQNEITAPYNIQFFNGATRAAFKRGYSIFLDIHCDFDKIKRHLVDGVLFSLDILAEQYINSVGSKYLLPVVTATNDASHMFTRPVHSVIIDNNKVVNMAIDYLMENGHRRIGLAIPEKGRYSEIRYKIWKFRMEQVLYNSGIKLELDDLVIRAEISDSDDVVKAFPDPPLIMQPTDDNFANYSSFNIGKRAAKHFMKLKGKMTALLCFNDDMAYGFIRMAEKNGLRVPEDISVMGIDGIYLRDWFERKVTTVSIEVENLGAIAANVLIDVLEDKKTKYMNWTSPKILEGETVKKVAGHGREGRT